MKSVWSNLVLAKCRPPNPGLAQDCLSCLRTQADQPGVTAGLTSGWTRWSNGMLKLNKFTVSTSCDWVWRDWSRRYAAADVYLLAVTVYRYTVYTGRPNLEISKITGRILTDLSWFRIMPNQGDDISTYLNRNNSNPEEVIKGLI